MSLHTLVEVVQNLDNKVLSPTRTEHAKERRRRRSSIKQFPDLAKDIITGQDNGEKGDDFEQTLTEFVRRKPHFAKVDIQEKENEAREEDVLSPKAGKRKHHRHHHKVRRKKLPKPEGEDTLLRACLIRTVLDDPDFFEFAKVQLRSFIVLLANDTLSQ